MSNWKAFPNKSWTLINKLLSGFGDGEGSYEIAYTINKEIHPFLNGRVAANIRLTANKPINGAGVIARADDLRSFVAFYVVTDETAPDMFSVRIAAFKDGKLNSMVGLKKSISIPNRQFHIALQFFSGDMTGQVTTDLQTYTLKYVLPEPPFPGFCGLIRFYNASVIAQNIHIEEITMRPILSKEDNNFVSQYPYHVFLSHSSADKDIIYKVIESFKKQGITYWVDHEQISFGDGIVSKIEEGLQKSRYVVVCLSKNLGSSNWCRAEYGPILYREFSGDTSRRVIPISLDGSNNNDNIPLLLSDKMRADFTNQSSLTAFLKFLRENKNEK